MVKVPLGFIRAEKQEVEAFKKNVKTNNEKPGEVVGNFLKQYNLTRGLDIREEKDIKQIAEAQADLEIVKKLRLEYTEFFSRQMIIEVDKVLSPIGPDGVRRTMTEKGLLYWIDRLSKKFNSKPASIRILVTQRIYEIFKDDTIELQRLLDIMQILNEDDGKEKEAVQ